MKRSAAQKLVEIQNEENVRETQKLLKRKGLGLVNPKAFPHSTEIQCNECHGEWTPTLVAGGGFARGSLKCPHCSQ